MLLTILLGVLIVVILLFHASLRHMRSALQNIPGPYCFPVIGSLYKAYGLTPGNLLQRAFDHFQRYGKVMYVTAFNHFLVVSADVEFSEQILSSNKHTVKHRNYKMLQAWLGNGLLVSAGQLWHSRRKIITPAFHFKILEDFIPTFDQHASVLKERLAGKAASCTNFDIYPYICSAALDIIAETAMGTKIFAQSVGGTAYASAVNEMTKLTIWRFIRIYVHSDFLFSLLYPLRKRRQKQLLTIMHNFTKKVIMERRISLATKSSAEVHNELDDNIGCKKRVALLDVLLQATTDGKPLTNEEIREEVDTFMFEGHDTNTTAICFALQLIAGNQRVQEKLFVELQAVLGEVENVEITSRHLSDLKYLECVIKEALRLYPPIPMIGREIQEDFKYKHSKLGSGVIPAGTEIIIDLHAIMRDAEIFEEADQFIPERFENKAILNAYSFIPFSAGPRNCIGQKYAMLVVKMILAKIVHSFEVLPLGEPMKPEMNIVLRSANGFQLGLRKRTPS